MVSFLDYEGNDPSSNAHEAGEALTNARKAVEAKGIKSFLFNASSVEEFDQRVVFGGVTEPLEEISDSYLGSPDHHERLVASLRREFEADRLVNPKGSPPDRLVNPKNDNFPNGQCPACGTGLDDDGICTDSDCSNYHHKMAQQKRNVEDAKKQGEELTHPGTIRGHESLAPEDTDHSLSIAGFDSQIINKPSDSPKERAENEKNRKASAKTASSYATPSGADVGYLEKRSKVNKICSTCFDEIETLSDEASTKEAALSGMCQDCQDDFFGQEKIATAPDNDEPNQAIEKNASNQSGGSIDETSKIPDWIQEALKN